MRLPHVTHIIPKVLQLPDFHHQEAAAQRGTAIHHFCRLASETGAVHCEHPEVAPAVETWLRESRALGFEPLWWERYMESKFGFCGKPDVLGKIAGEYYLIDIKSGKESQSWGYQLAAYTMLIRENMGITEPIHRRIFQVDREGKYGIKSSGRTKAHGAVDFDSSVFDSLWSSILNVYRELQ